MKTLIAGAAGFIGNHLANRLVGEGHEVRAFVRPTSDYAGLQERGVEVVAGSIEDVDLLSRACADIDVVYNLIGQIGGWGVTRKEMRYANVMAVKQLLTAVSGSGVSHLVHCSTPGVVGMRGVAPESLPCKPTGYYEVTKYDGEKQVLGWQGDGKTAVTVVRPDFVYGPGDLHKLKLFRVVRSGKFVLVGAGQSLLHPTYIDDIIDGFSLIGGNPSAFGQIFNLAGPEPVTVSRLVSAIARLLGVSIPRRHVPVLLAKAAAVTVEQVAHITGTDPIVTRYQVDFFSRDHASDISKARLTLGYKPKVPLEDGVARTIDWYRSQHLL